MKTNNKKKIVVSVLALAMGAGLAGSISGSVAWYQYSTRTSANFVGTTAGTTRELQLSVDNGANWDQDVTIPAATFRPTSIFKDAQNKLHFVDHPVYKSAVLPEITDNTVEGYKLEFSFVFRCLDGNTQAAKDVYLTYFDIVEGENATKNIVPAVRVYIEGASISVSEEPNVDPIQNKFILGKEAGTTNTYGQLDLNGNEVKDRDGYDTNDVYDKDGNKGDNVPFITYTNVADQTPSYSFLSPSSAVIHDSSDPYNFADDHKSDKLLTKTSDSGASAPVKVTVWIEGWQKLATGNELNPTSSVWDSTWLQQDFELRFQFACEADR